MSNDYREDNNEEYYEAEHSGRDAGEYGDGEHGVERDGRSPGRRPARGRVRRRRDTGRSCLASLMYAAFVLGVSMFLAAFVIICANEVFAFVKPDRTAVVEISEDADTQEISKTLADAGIIKYPLLFKIYCAVSGAEFKSGKYELNANLDYSAIARKLKNESNYRETVRVTIPEGYTQNQVVDMLVENGVCTEDKLNDAIQNADFDYSFIDSLDNTEKRLEGYLFPDTYEFYKDDDAENVLKKFLDNFDTRYNEKLKDRTTELGMSIKDVVIIASMIEREAKLDNERAVIASVIYNRLADPGNFPYLQIDATIQYLTGEVPTADDKNIDSPYNTYMYSGLPIGPISNPGLASIEAALYPDDTDYYFYVAKSDGSHVFAQTYDEHQQNIADIAEEG